MTDSDERLDPDHAPEASLQEHLARYRFARERVRGRVLDVACGTGYGTVMLGAVGLDKSLEALQRAGKGKAMLLAGDASRLPFRRVFDTIVSFETVEHLQNPERFVAECIRVLRPEGMLIISTPNRELWSPRSLNPLQRFHIREYTRREFLALLRPLKVQLFGQCLLSRREAALFEWKELAKRVVRALFPIRRFRPRSELALEELEPDPAYAVLPCGQKTPCVFVAVATP